jgi:aryl-alcohol dehydrogenase-like predicted oxidoreductase
MLVAGHRIEGIGLGTAQFAFRDGTPEDSVATVRAALDAGVRLIDTALAYTRAGVESYAEQVVARALRGIARDRPLVATKCGHWRDGDTFPAIGLSNVTIAQLDAALTAAPVASVQNRLSYGDPRDLPTALACAQRSVAYLAYSPFGGPSGTAPETAAAVAVARRRGVSVHRVLLAWLRAQSPNIVPLAGASRPASIRDSAAPADLASQDLEDLREAGRSDLH